MNVLLINGSPNKEGCTYTALSLVAEELNKAGIDTNILWVGNKPVIGCTDCKGCRKAPDGLCVFGEGNVNEAVALAEKADGIIVGSAVHYASASGAICSFLDRMFFSSASKFAHKPGAAIVSCRRSGGTAALERLNKYFTISQMPLVSSCYWNAIHGNTPEEVMQDLEGVEIMRTLGRNMAYILKCKEAAKAAGINPPERMQRPFTNFIR